MQWNHRQAGTVIVMMKRAIILVILAFYAVSALAVAPQPAAHAMAHSMAHDGAALPGDHHGCDSTGVAAAGADHEPGCGECARGFAHCCVAMPALACVAACPGLVAFAYSRPPSAELLRPVRRGESIYRPPRA